MDKIYTKEKLYFVTNNKELLLQSPIYKESFLIFICFFYLGIIDFNNISFLLKFLDILGELLNPMYFNIPFSPFNLFEDNNLIFLPLLSNFKKLFLCSNPGRILIKELFSFKD